MSKMILHIHTPNKRSNTTSFPTGARTPMDRVCVQEDHTTHMLTCFREQFLPSPFSPKRLDESTLRGNKPSVSGDELRCGELLCHTPQASHHVSHPDRSSNACKRFPFSFLKRVDSRCRNKILEIREIRRHFWLHLGSAVACASPMSGSSPL